MIEVLSRIANVLRSRKLDAVLEKLEQKDEIQLMHPEKVTINDCTLAYQMGYITEIENGRVKMFRKKAPIEGAKVKIQFQYNNIRKRGQQI